MSPERFTKKFRKWRTTARRYSRQSILKMARARLHSQPGAGIESLKLWPWLTCLLIKWVYQDKEIRNTGRPSITPEQFHGLLEGVFKISKANSGYLKKMPLRLSTRRLMRNQQVFQVSMGRGYIREAMLIANAKDPELRNMFHDEIGCSVTTFFDLAVVCITQATLAAKEGRSLVLDETSFQPLEDTYGKNSIESFISSISSTAQDLRSELSNLPDVHKKTDSELFELPFLTRAPLLRSNGKLTLWHPQLFYRGLEHFVHNTLSVRSGRYSEAFGDVFEDHITDILSNCNLQTFTESQLKSWRTSTNQKHPDGLICVGNANIFVECKSGLYIDSIFSTHSTLYFERTTKEIVKGIEQARSAGKYVHQNPSVPDPVKSNMKTFALIVTNVNLGICSGLALSEMYSDKTIQDENPETLGTIPLNCTMIMNIDEFEWMLGAANAGDIDLDSFLSDCAEKDLKQESKVAYFSQRLESGVPLYVSDRVQTAFDESTERVIELFENHD